MAHALEALVDPGILSLDDGTAGFNYSRPPPPFHEARAQAGYLPWSHSHHLPQSRNWELGVMQRHGSGMRLSLSRGYYHTPAEKIDRV